MTIALLFLAIFVAAALFVGPEIAWQRAAILGKSAVGIICLILIVACLLAFLGVIVWGLISVIRSLRNDPVSTLVTIAMLLLLLSLRQILERLIQRLKRRRTA
jgi:hypothetical protein